MVTLRITAIHGGPAVQKLQKPLVRNHVWLWHPQLLVSMMDLKLLVTNSSLMKKMGIYIISVEGSTLTSYFYLPRSGDMPTLLGHLHTGFTCFPPVPSPHTCPGNSVHEIAPGGEDSKTFDT